MKVSPSATVFFLCGALSAQTLDTNPQSTWDCVGLKPKQKLNLRTPSKARRGGTLSFFATALMMRDPHDLKAERCIVIYKLWGQGNNKKAQEIKSYTSSIESS